MRLKYFTYASGLCIVSVSDRPACMCLHRQDVCFRYSLKPNQLEQPNCSDALTCPHLLLLTRYLRACLHGGFIHSSSSQTGVKMPVHSRCNSLERSYTTNSGILFQSVLCSIELVQLVVCTQCCHALLWQLFSWYPTLLCVCPLLICLFTCAPSTALG